MMMGMVLVACFAARLVTKFPLTRASTLGCTSLPTGLAPSPSSPRGRETQPEYFCFQYNQTPMALSECLDSRSGSIGVAATRGKSYSRYFLRLLRLGRIDSRHDKANQHKNSFHAPIFTAVRDALSRKFLGQNVRYSIRSGVILSRSFSGVSPAELRSLAQDVGRYEPHPVHGCVAALLHVGGPFVGPA